MAENLKPYTLTLTYMVPYSAAFTVYAKDPEAACAKAFDILDKDPAAYDAFVTSAEWETGQTFVDDMVEGETPWGSAGVGPMVPVPAGWCDPQAAIRKAAQAVLAATHLLDTILNPGKTGNGGGGSDSA
jgi:hypothetical protein